MNQLLKWLFWTCIAAGFALQPVRAAERIGSAHGFLQDMVVSLARDDQGFVWIGTPTGLFRFDGRHVRALPWVDRSGKPVAGQINALAVEGNGLWIATSEHGLWWLDLSREMFHHVPFAVDGSSGVAPTIRSLSSENQGTLWFGTDGLGVLKTEVDWQARAPIIKSVQSFQYLKDDPASLPANRVWTTRLHGDYLWAGSELGMAQIHRASGVVKRLNLPAPMPLNGAVNVEETLAWVDGSVWIGTWDHGLFRWFPESGQLKRYELPNYALDSTANQLRVFALEPDGNRGVWIGTEMGLRHWQADCDCIVETQVRDLHQGGDSGFRIRSMAPDGYGGVLIGAWGFGLWRVTASDLWVKRMPHPKGQTDEVPSGQVRAIHEDRNGTIWLGTSDRGLFQVQRIQQGLHDEVKYRRVHDLARDSYRSRFIWALHEDEAGNLWVGSDDGLAILSRDRRTWSYPDNTRLPGLGVRALMPHPEHGLLVATSSGLARVDARRHIERIDLGLDADRQGLGLTLQSILLLANGQLLLGSYDGLHVMSAGLRLQKTFREGEQGFKGRVVHGMVSEGVDQLMVATSAGLCQTTISGAPETWQWRCESPFDNQEGPRVMSLARDLSGDLWLASTRALLRWRGPDDRLRVEPFARLDDESIQLGGGLLTRDGRLLYGTSDGWLALDAKRKDGQSLRWPVRPVLTELRDSEGLAVRDLQGRIAPHLTELKRKHNDTGLVLQVGSPSSPHAAQLSWQYRLDRSPDSTWLDSDHGHIDLHHMVSGQYQLEVRAREPDGRVGEAVTVLALAIAPPFWSTNVFRVLLGLALIALMMAVYAWRTRGLREQRAALTSEVAARTRDLERNAAALKEMNSRLFEASIRDPLTELFNRRHFFNCAERLLSEADATDRTLALVLLDLDHFKQINDHHGHQAGDRVLREIAKVLTSSVRQDEPVGRYGGEEFALLLSRRDATELRVWAEMLMTKVRGLDIANGDAAIRVTLSLGMVQRPPYADMDLDEWIARADQALYDAKHAGRNQAVFEFHRES